MYRKITSIIITAVVSAAIAFPCTAGAASLAAASVAPSVSLPYVDDVNEWGAGRCVLTVVASGSPAKLKATSGGKALKVRKHHRNVWTVVVKRRAGVKLSVRAGGGKWKSIGYRVY